MKIAIHGRNFAAEVSPAVQAMFDWLAARQIPLQISLGFRQFLLDFGLKLPNHSTYANTNELFDATMIFTIGGDGTLLDAVTHVGARAIPILGINTGRLGFLATISPDDIEKALLAITNQQYTIEERSLVAVHAHFGAFDVEGANFALNDAVIAKTETSSMITIDTYLDNAFLNSYWADGLIISTPTGSTGYSLSCGGPVLLPQNQNFIITPMSPHNLSVRPLVIPDSSELRLKVTSRSNGFLLSLDSRFQKVEDTVELTIKKADFKARLIKFGDERFLETLRQKLHWGLDTRSKNKQ